MLSDQATASSPTLWAIPVPSSRVTASGTSLCSQLAAILCGLVVGLGLGVPVAWAADGTGRELHCYTLRDMGL